MTGELVGRLLDPRPLSAREVRATFACLIAERSSDAERAAVLVALAARPRRTSELVAFAREMRRRAVPFPIPARETAVDLCGSGGADRPSFNVSTVGALVVRAAGVPVVKHGNRSRGICGSSDLLEALGLPVTTSIAFARESHRRLGIAFLHAPLFHPATRAVAAVRRTLGIPTIFNRLGPLTNPARVRCQVSGATNVGHATEAAGALRALGVVRGLSMTSDDGCDEFSPRAPTTVVAWDTRGLHRSRLRPDTLLHHDDRRGDWGPLPPHRAADEAERILAGGGGARRGSVLLTGGAALWVAGRARSLAAGVGRARDALDSGEAERVLADLRALAERYPAPEAS